MEYTCVENTLIFYKNCIVDSRSSSMMVTIDIEFPTRIVKASSPSRATLSFTTRSVKSIQAIGPGGFTVIDALAPKSESVIKRMHASDRGTSIEIRYCGDS